jgi:hypothetical protein
MSSEFTLNISAVKIKKPSKDYFASFSCFFAKLSYFCKNLCNFSSETLTN